MSLGRPPTNKISAALRARIAQRVREVSVAQTAWECGVSETSVRNIRDEFGIAPRPRGMPSIWGRPLHRRFPAPTKRSLRPRGQVPLEWVKEETAA